MWLVEYDPPEKTRSQLSIRSEHYRLKAGFYVLILSLCIINVYVIVHFSLAQKWDTVVTSPLYL